MAIGTTETKTAARGGSRVRMPAKRSINLAAVTEKRINKKVAVPAVILILIAAVLIGKFAVADRLVSAARLRAEAAGLHTQLSAANAKLADYGEIADTYAHYTLVGMTEEELGRADRVAVADMIRSTVMNRVTLTGWSLADNELTLNFTGKSLDTVSELTRTLEQNELVSFCSVTSATTGDETGEDQSVTATVIVYLNKAAEGADGQ